jgi:hypothetical protein
MSTDTVHMVKDPREKRRVVFAIARHMDWEPEAIYAMEKEDALFSDGEKWMLVPSGDEALYISLPFSEPVLRIKHFPEMQVCELWDKGFVAEFQVFPRSTSLD